MIAELTTVGGLHIAADQPVSPADPTHDTSIAARQQDLDRARALLTEAGVEIPYSVTLYIGDLSEIPNLAEMVVSQAAGAGFDISIDVTPNADFYREHWCPDLDTCDEAKSFGIVDYGHRPIPSVYFERSFGANGDWNPSNFDDAEYEDALSRYENAATLEDATAASQELQRMLSEKLPAVIPYFIDYVWAHRSGLTGIETTWIGQISFVGAAQAP